MADQIALFNTDEKSKVIIHVSISSLSISRYNPRKTRSDEYITNLAERIQTNGYEITRAMWACRNDDGYDVFAGGTRLKAARQAGIQQVPIVLHTGYTDAEIVHLADLDNENDEYHEPISTLDVWASYQDLADMGWTHQEIADAKGVGRTVATERIGFHNLPDNIKEFVYQHLLTEGHLRQITALSNVRHFFSWLTTSQTQLEMAEWAAKSHTVRETETRVKKWKEFITAAERIYEDLDETITLYDLTDDEPQAVEYHPCEEFVDHLAKNKARSLTAVNSTKGQITIYISDNLKYYKIWVDARTAEEARKAIRARKEEELLSKVHLGNYQDVLEQIPDESIDLIFTDPPYDKDHIEDYGKLAEIASRKLKHGGHLIAYAGHYALPTIFDLMRPHLRYWWLLGIRHGGGLSSLTGKKVYVQYKPLVWFVKDHHGGEEFVFDLKDSNPTNKELHKWEQSTEEAKYYIEHLTQKGDLVVDPFCGSGTTAMAALELDRDLIVSDIDKESIETTSERLIKWIE